MSRKILLACIFDFGAFSFPEVHWEAIIGILLTMGIIAGVLFFMRVRQAPDNFGFGEIILGLASISKGIPLERFVGRGEEKRNQRDHPDISGIIKGMDFWVILR